MKTEKEIKHLIGFCEIVKDEFPIEFLNEVSTLEGDLKHNQTVIQSAALSKSKECNLVGKNGFFQVKSTNYKVVANILNWLLEE